MPPQLKDVANGIINITSNPSKNQFTPSEVSDYLQEKKFSSLGRATISANVSNNLKSLCDYELIRRDPDNKQKRNRPCVIIDREGLRKQAKEDVVQDDISNTLPLFDTNSLVLRLEKTEERLAALEKNIFNNSLVKNTKGEMSSIIRLTTEF